MSVYKLSLWNCTAVCLYRSVWIGLISGMPLLHTAIYSQAELSERARFHALSSNWRRTTLIYDAIKTLGAMNCICKITPFEISIENDLGVEKN
jgi:hypothetical protein